MGKLKNNFIEITSLQVINSASLFLNIPVGDILRKTRKREIKEARQMCIKIIYEDLNYTLVETANLFCGGQHNSTALRAKKYISDLCDSDIDFKQRFLSLRSFIFKN